MPGEVLLTVTRGPASGRRAKLADGMRLVIGRSRRADLVINEPGLAPRHVEIERSARGLVVRDLAREGAVTIQGRPLAPGGELVLTEDSRLELARTEIYLSLSHARAPEPPHLPAGYKHVAKLGQGVHAEVHSAVHEVTSHSVAIKILKETADRVAVERMRRELVLQKKLEHPGIVRAEELVEQGGRLYLICELVEGHSLAHELRRQRMAIERAVAIMAQVAAAVAYAHEKGVIHRDVSPGNIIVRDDGTAKLADFGLAKPILKPVKKSEAPLTATGEAMGAKYYCAPEAFYDGKRAGPPADVYGIGAVLYECISGRTPVEDADMAAWADGRPGGAPKPLGEVASGVPQRLDRLVMRMLSRAPEARPTALESASVLSGT